MLRFDKPRLEGPALPFIGSAIGGWLGTGTAVGAIGGSLIGGLAGTLLSGGAKTPSFPSSTLPGAPTPPELPQASPLQGTGAPATTTDLTKGEMDTAQRRGRVASILSSQRKAGVSDEVERLG